MQCAAASEDQVTVSADSQYGNEPMADEAVEENEESFRIWNGPRQANLLAQEEVRH